MTEIHHLQTVADARDEADARYADMVAALTAIEPTKGQPRSITWAQWNEADSAVGYYHTARDWWVMSVVALTIRTLMPAVPSALVLPDSPLSHAEVEDLKITWNRRPSKRRRTRDQELEWRGVRVLASLVAALAVGVGVGLALRGKGTVRR